VVLIVVQLCWRAQVAARGYLSTDDFVLAARAAESGLTADYLLHLFNNHLMPGALLMIWLVSHAIGLAYWPYVLLMIACQAMVSIALFALLRRLLKPGWLVLVPLGVFLFSPLTLEATSWWVVGMNVLPMQLAMVLAIGSQVSYVRTGRLRHVVTLVLSVLLGLLFFEKSLLIVPFVFLLTACLLASGGPVRTAIETFRRYWRAWVALTLVSLGFLGLYLSRTDLSRTDSTLRHPASALELARFFGQIVGSTVVPGLLGGPWRWLDTGDGPPVAAPPELARWLAWAVFAGLIVCTVRWRPVAVRAWVLLASYLLLVACLLAATRLGTIFSGVAGLAPRYVGELVVVAAVCIGAAVAGLADRTGETPAHLAGEAPRGRATPARSPAIVLVTLIVLIASSAWSTAPFGDAWAVKRGRDYLQTARDALAAAPVDTVFFDAPVPEQVVGGLSYPYSMQSHFFWPLRPRPEFVRAAENPSMFDEAGRIRPVRIDGVANQPGPVAGCGYKLSGGQPVRIPLQEPILTWVWVIRVAYISSGDSPATVRLGGTVGRFQARRGLNQIFVLVEGGGDTVDLAVLDPAVTLCTNEITVGKAYPRM
jgi:hypothetical protein